MTVFWRFAALAITALFTHPSLAPADEVPVPPPPAFAINGIDVNGHPYHKDSVNNVLDANLGRNNFWRQIAFAADGDNSKLRIVYWCTAAHTQGTPLSEGPFTRNNLCPDVPVQNLSRGVQRVKLALSGSEASNYNIHYECWIGCSNQPIQNPGGQHTANEWCGVMPPDPALNCWVQRIAVTIRAN